MKALWSNEISKECLSKFVQKVQKYLNLNFYNDWIGTYEVINIFCDDIILQTLLFCIKVLLD